MIGWEVIPRIGFGSFTVSPHGVGIAAGYFAGAVLLARRARERGFNEDHAWNAAALSVIGAIVGARVAYVVGHFNDFDGPLEWLQIYKGGISLVGGLLGGFLAGYLYCRKKKLDFLELADLGAPGIAIGTAIGRIGDLVIGDHLGKQTSGFWGWEYKGGELISPPACIYDTIDTCIKPGMVVHQTAIYDMLWSLVIFGILMRLDRTPRPRGFLTYSWASLYAAGRIATDFTRVDKHWFGLNLTGSQLTSMAVLALCAYLLYKQKDAGPAKVDGPAARSHRNEEETTAGDGERRTRSVILDRPATRREPRAKLERVPKAKPAPEPEIPEGESVFKSAREKRGRPEDADQPATGPKAAARPTGKASPAEDGSPAARPTGKASPAEDGSPAARPTGKASPAEDGSPAARPAAKPAEPRKPSPAPAPQPVEDIVEDDDWEP
ncbi:MAG: prolipoprotein diacylglyceryl transferase family protein [Actinomycetota bacterium]